MPTVCMIFLPWYAPLYPFIELNLGLLYFFRIALFTTNILTFLLMSINSIGVLIALLKKEHFTCACLGTLFKIPMTYVTLIEDVIMAAMALYMLLY